MNRMFRHCACRRFVLIVISLLIPIGMATAAPCGDANPFERSTFGNDWGILDNDTFFGGADALFGLSPAGRTLLLLATSDSKTTSARSAIVSESAKQVPLPFPGAIGSPFSLVRGPIGSSGVGPVPTAPTPPDFYWDTNGTTPGVGGFATTATWNLVATNWNEPSGTGAPAAWVNGNIAHFAGVPGIVSVSGTVTPTSASFEVTGYTLQPANTTDTLNGPIVLDAGVNLFIHSLTLTSDRTLQIGGSISGGPGSGITIQGAQTGSNHARVILTAANSVISVPITIAKTGAGPGGVVGNAAGQQVTGPITNNSPGATLLGAGTGGSLTVSGAISGTAGLRLGTDAAAASGAGIVTLTGNNTFTGGTVVSTATSGLAVLASTTGQALGATSSVAVNNGTLRWGVSDQINNTAGVSLGGGTMALNGFSEGAPGTNGLGALTLTANSTIDFASGATSSIIQFAGITAHTPATGFDLLITNWNGNADMGGGPERLLFSGNVADFISQYAQSDVSFNGLIGYNAYQFGGFYEITAVPEPSTWMGAALAIAAIGFTQRKRFAKPFRLEV